MAEAANHPFINGRRLISQLKAQRTSVFTVVFIFFFVSFTLHLAFTPSSSSSSSLLPNIFASFSTSNSSSNSSKSNQTQSVDLRDKAEILKPNQSTIEAPKSPVTDNRTENSVPDSSTSRKNASGSGEGKVTEKGLVSNFSSSVLEKQSNGTNAGLSAKQGSENLVEKLMNCDLFDGEWVRDESYPLYEPGSCSLVPEHFNCFVNGRPDNDYYKLKWKPNGCSLPRMHPGRLIHNRTGTHNTPGSQFLSVLYGLNGSHMLELLRGKRLVFVGDSINKNMWESLVCILTSSVENQSKVHLTHGSHSGHLEKSHLFQFGDYDCTIEFFVSPYLVQEWEMETKNGLKMETLRLDMMRKSANKYRSADIIIFNTGHWWTHAKASKGKDYYQEGSHVYGELDVLEAFRKALTTWGRWVDANINPTKTLVLFRGFAATHYRGRQRNSGTRCDRETEPIKNKTFLSPYPQKMEVLEKVLKGMKTPISYMNISRMTDYRKDGHPSIYQEQNLSKKKRKARLSILDCSHWCLPGVPDMWNELLYAELLRKKK